MWLCLPFAFRKHTIQRMSRLWHLPSWVGRTEECCIRVVTPCMKISVAQEGHICSSNQLVHAYCILGVGALPAHNVLQTNDNHRQSDLNHYFVMFFAQKSRTILNSVIIMIKTEVVCWLRHPELINSWGLFGTGTHCILQERFDFAFPLFVGNTPSNVYQDFYTCLVG